VKVSPYQAVSISAALLGLVLLVAAVLYYVFKSKRSRETPVYLSGEGEDVVSMIVPSVASLYWGFMKRFAKSLYKALIEKVHTGSLHDWYKFISSWFGALLLISILVYLIYALPALLR